MAAYVSFIFGVRNLYSGHLCLCSHPFFDVIFGQNNTNLSDTQQKSKAVNQLFDWMLYLNLPIVFGLLSYCLFQVSTHSYTTLSGLVYHYLLEYYWTTPSMLHMNSVIANLFERSKQNPLYPMFVYALLHRHNFGHHMKVATPDDGATAKYNQNVYSFWVRSVTKQYVDAWKKQMELLRAKIDRSFLL